jgi:hypothetical protein
MGGCIYLGKMLVNANDSLFFAIIVVYTSSVNLFVPMYNKVLFSSLGQKFFDTIIFFVFLVVIVQP